MTADPPDEDSGDLDRFGWGPGEFILDSSPAHSAEEIAAFNAEQRALGLARIAAKKAAKAAEDTTNEAAGAEVPQP